MCGVLVGGGLEMVVLFDVWDVGRIVVLVVVLWVVCMAVGFLV